MAKLLLLFTLIPFVEIALLLNIGDIIGGWTTFFIVILTAFVGAKLVRQQGLQTLQSAQRKMATGQLPGEEISTAVALLVAGVLLITPGFMTDALGLALLTPGVRKPLTAIIVHKLLKNMQVVTPQGRGHVYEQHTQSSQQEHTQSHSHVIEGEFERQDEKK